MKRCMVGALLLTLASLAPGSLGGDATVEGFWKGSIDATGEDSIEVMIDIERRDDRWNASITAPVQGIRNVDMTGVEIAEHTVKFQIPGVAGTPTFIGRLSDDGLTISGDFTQNDKTMRFSLARTDKPEQQEDIYAEFRGPGTAGEGFAGTWRGLLVSGPHRMRLVLRIDGSADGGFEASVNSLDQGSREIAVDALTVQNATVWLQMIGIGAEYEATLKDDGSEMVGLWRQTGQEFRIRFLRSGD